MMVERKVLRLASVILFTLCILIPVRAQMIPPGASDTGLGGINTITGTIVVAGQRMMQRHVTVRLRTMTKGDRVVVTDDYGNFAFRGLVSGDYTIVIDKEKDFQPFSQVVSIIQPRGFPPQTYNLSIRLTLKDATAAKPSVINADLAKIPKRALELFNKAQELAKNGDRSEAIEQLKAAIVEYPEFMLAYNEIGVQYLKLNDLQKSDEALQAALKIDPKAFMPLMNRGIVLVALKRYKDAEPLLREAVSMKGDQAITHYFLGQAVANLGNFDEAEKELSTAIKLGGDEMKEAHRLLAIIYSSRGDKNHAIAELETYLRLNPTTPDAEQLRNAILKLKDPNAVKPGAVNAEFANAPKKALAHYDAASELSKKGDHTGAIEELKLAIAEHPTLIQAFNELGVQYLKLNQLPEADAAFQGALKLDAEYFTALINRGNVNLMMKRYGEAVPILRKALKKNDQSAVAHYFLGQALANLGLFDEAEQALLASLKLGKEGMKEAHRILATIYTSRGAKQQAATELETYLKLAPDTPDAEKLREMIRKLKETN